MATIDYKGYRISVSALEWILQEDDGSRGEWSGAYRIWQHGHVDPIEGIIEGRESSSDDAEQRTLRIVKVAIDETLHLSGKQLRTSLTQLGDRFAL